MGRKVQIKFVATFGKSFLANVKCAQFDRVEEELTIYTEIFQERKSSGGRAGSVESTAVISHTFFSFLHGFGFTNIPLVERAPNNRAILKYRSGQRFI